MMGRRGSPARSRLDISTTPREAQLRWYLEDFPSHPYDSAPTLAEAARPRMRELGDAMCSALRAAGSSPLLDWCLGEGLPETAIEILGAPGTVAWELPAELRDRADPARSCPAHGPSGADRR
jgi:hypothetical protein